jgi:hypothetical protein
MSPKKTPAGLLCLMMVLLAAGVSGQQSPTPATVLPHDPNDLVRKVVQNELFADANDHTHWRYRNHKESDGSAQDRDVIETRDGSLARTLLINGRPLTQDERNKDEQRMKQLVNDPNERAKRERRAKQDEEKAQELLKAIPDAFIFRYDGTDGPLIRLAFTPRSDYSPPTRELSVYHAMAGKLWVDRVSLRLAMIQGRLMEEVRFGWGLLGHLDKGGTFTVIRQNVGDNHWDTVSLDVNMQGRAVIFKSLNVKERETLTDFRRMPDDLTIARAFELLQQGTASTDPGGQTTASK